MKKYEVTIDMDWSIKKTVKAKSKAEAKKKAWEKFNKNIPKKVFTIYSEEINH